MLFNSSLTEQYYACCYALYSVAVRLLCKALVNSLNPTWCLRSSRGLGIVSVALGFLQFCENSHNLELATELEMWHTTSQDCTIFTNFHKKLAIFISFWSLPPLLPFSTFCLGWAELNAVFLHWLDFSSFLRICSRFSVTVFFILFYSNAQYFVSSHKAWI